PRGIARGVTIAATVLCLAYTVIVFIGSWQDVSKMYEIGILAQDMRIPQWIPRSVLPVGFALLFYRFCEVLVHLVRGEEGGLLADEAEEALKLLDEDGGEGRR